MNMPCSAGHKDCGRPVPGDIFSFFKLKSSNLIACPHFTLQKGREGFVFFQCNFFRIHTGFLSFHCLTRTLFGRWKRLDSVTCLEVVSFISLTKKVFSKSSTHQGNYPLALQFTHFQWLMVSWFGVEPAFVLGPNSTRAAPQISTLFCETRKTHLLFPSCLLVVVIIIMLIVAFGPQSQVKLLRAKRVASHLLHRFTPVWCSGLLTLSVQLLWILKATG